MTTIPPIPLIMPPPAGAVCCMGAALCWGTGLGAVVAPLEGLLPPKKPLPELLLLDGLELLLDDPPELPIKNYLKMYYFHLLLAFSL